MASSVRIVHDRHGIGELLRSDAVADDLNRRAAAVQQAAQARRLTVESDDVPLPVTTESDRTGSRARARVVIDHPAGLAVESMYRLLVGSLDAARG